MANKITPDMEEFINKMQNQLQGLYDEYVSIENNGIEYECPIDRLVTGIFQEAICKSTKELISENDKSFE